MADTSKLSNFLEDVADAIRTKKETTDKIPAENFDTEILSIEGGIDTSDATATASDIIMDKTAYVNGEKITGTIESVEELGLDISAVTATDPEDDGCVTITSKNVPADVLLREDGKIILEETTLEFADRVGLSSSVLVTGNKVLGIEGNGTSLTNADYQTCLSLSESILRSRTNRGSYLWCKTSKKFF